MAEERKPIFKDEVDRIEVDRGFGLVKCCYGLGLMRMNLNSTTRSLISLSNIAMNDDRLTSFFIQISEINFSRFVGWISENVLITPNRI